jgi:hypothetical protein
MMFRIPSPSDIEPIRGKAMSTFEAIHTADKAHADAGVLAVQLFHVARAVERDEDCVARYTRAIQLYADLGRRLVALAEIVQPKLAIAKTETVI